MIHEWCKFIASCNTEPSGFLNQNNGAIQAISTVILVFVTAYSVIQARRTIKEMKEARLHEFLPILEIDVHSIDSNRIRITIGNIGKSVARKVMIFLPLTASPIDLQDIGLRNTRETEGTIDVARILTLPEEQRKIRIEYLDVFSRKIVSEAILVTEIQEEGHSRGSRLTIGAWNLILPK